MTKNIKDYENYTINENGEVFNLITKQYLKGSIGLNGYKYYRLSKDNQKKMFYAHRLVAKYFIPNENNAPVVNHLDGDKLNNNVNNLEWTSYSENTKHAHSLSSRGTVRQREYYEEDLPGENWKKIYDFPYSASTCGRVKNDRTNLILKPSITCGYYKVTLSVENKRRDFMIHNLIYCLFNEKEIIPQGYVVDHIDGNKLNNKLDNLRLITLSENVNFALYVTKTNHNVKAVECYKDGEYIETFPSTREAARQLNLDSSTISKVCRGKNKSHGGYTFRYKENS